MRVLVEGSALAVVLLDVRRRSAVTDSSSCGGHLDSDHLALSEERVFVRTCNQQRTASRSRRFSPAERSSTAAWKGIGRLRAEAYFAPRALQGVRRSGPAQRQKGTSILLTGCRPPTGPSVYARNVHLLLSGSIDSHMGANGNIDRSIGLLDSVFSLHGRLWYAPAQP